MESIEKLRNIVGTPADGSMCYSTIAAALDEIERECAEMEAFCERIERAAKARDELDVFGVAYMPLPLDADGVPIRIGDKLVDGSTPREVVAIADNYVMLGGYPGTGSQRNRAVPVSAHKHFKPRTLEDVLQDLAYMDPVHRYADEDFDHIIGKFAMEIRELMGVRE